jgi:hypothetical protein
LCFSFNTPLKTCFKTVILLFKNDAWKDKTNNLLGWGVLVEVGSDLLLKVDYNACISSCVPGTFDQWEIGADNAICTVPFYP